MIQRINKTKLVKMAGVSRNTFDKRYMAWIMQNEPPMYQNERIIEWTADAALLMLRKTKDARRITALSIGNTALNSCNGGLIL